MSILSLFYVMGLSYLEAYFQVTPFSLIYRVEAIVPIEVMVSSSSLVLQTKVVDPSDISMMKRLSMKRGKMQKINIYHTKCILVKLIRTCKTSDSSSYRFNFESNKTCAKA